MRLGLGQPRIRIETDRLILRPAQPGDFKAWSSLREQSRQHLRPWEPAWPSDVHSRDDWRRRFHVWNDLRKTARGYILHIWRKSDRALIGSVSITNVQFPPISTARLGYWLGAEHTGQGFMIEAVRTACGWARSELGVLRIEAATLPENEPSQAVLERTGFEKEGYAKSYLQICGERRDHILYALTFPTVSEPRFHDSDRHPVKQPDRR